MALTRTGTALSSLKTVIEAASFTNVDVTTGVLPTGSKSLHRIAKDIIRGNATIMIMPRRERFSSLSNTTKGRVNLYQAPLQFSIGIYSKFFNTDQDEDLLKILDGVTDLMHNKRYTLLDSSISDANYTANNNDMYYEARLEVEVNKQYPTT